MESFLIQALLYLTAAVIAVPLATRLGLGSVLGYLAAGIALGPALGLAGSDVEDVRHVAEFGVVLMLFLIGLELEPKTLWGMRSRLIGLGGLQVTLTTLAIMGAAMALNLAWKPALAVGLIFALSSTAIVLQTLSEKGLIPTPGGRATFSVLLMQDIAVIPMLVALPLLASAEKASLGADGSVRRHAVEAMAAHKTELSLIDGLSGWAVALVTLGAIAAVILAGHYLIRPIFRFVHMAHLREMYTAVALLLVIGIAVLMTLVGLSPALGTFLAGVVLADSEFRHELESNIEPFKGLLLGLFFITVGAGIDFGVLLAEPARIVALTLLVMTIKGVILFGLGRLFRLRGRDQWLFTLGLAQAGEFGFVLVGLALQQRVLPEAQGQTLLLIIALSMLLTPLFFIVYEMLSRRLAEAARAQDRTAPDEIDERQPIIIVGIGRFGQVVQRMLQMAGHRATVIDNDLPLINLMRRFGIKGFFGDPRRPETLFAAGLSEARVLVVALEDAAATTKVVEFARRARPDLKIVARARDRGHVYLLYRAGADEIVRELFDSSLRAARYTLEAMGLSEFEAREMESAFFDFDRHVVRELASVWKPDVPVARNEDYVRRARELNTELETALLSRVAARQEAEVEDAEEQEADAQDAAGAKAEGSA